MNRAARRPLQALLALIVVGVVGVAIYWSTRPVVRLYIWEDYLPRHVIWNYQWKRQVRVEVVNYRNNAEMLARVKLSWGEFDVIMPSNYMLDELRRRDLLLRLTPSDVPEIANIDSRFMRGKTNAVRQHELAVAAEAGRAAEARRKAQELATTNQQFEPGIFADKPAPVKARPVDPSAPEPVARGSLESRLQVGVITTALAAEGDFGDPDNAEYGLPYLYNYAGIGYRDSGLRETPVFNSWADLFNPDVIRRFGHRVAFLDEQRETMGLALLALGLSPNTQNEVELERLRESLLALRDASKDGPRFVLSEGRSELAAGNLEILSTWSPEITGSRDDLRADDKDPEQIRYALPAAGSILTFDTLAIPRSSRHPELARDFIRYLLSPEVADVVSEWSRYAHTLKGSVRSNDALAGTPSRREPERTFVLQDLGEAQHRYDAIWNEFRPRQQRARDAEHRSKFFLEPPGSRIKHLAEDVRAALLDAAYVLTGPSVPARRD